ncbi:maleylacetoacetate isomerase [uncultured Roseobacter sp.]|uniref:maleylacetoacetate isomerase n=1 Tax=uncultured Roseobacter sp. TaxID=114847 RepID=UPI002639F4A9|nr:maleylacetoacetate isomerase [uncultured Roseobacter sp.]
MITLYDSPGSSASYRVRIALGLAEERWQTKTVDLQGGGQRKPAHLARNPQGRVPVLDVDGLQLTQSLAIIEYLNGTRRLGLLPDTPAARARVQALAHAIAMEIHPICNRATATWAVDRSGGTIALDTWMQHFIATGLAAYEEMLDGSAYSFGAGVTLADLCLIPQLYNARLWGVDLAGCPKIQRVEATLQAIPAVRHAHPDRAPTYGSDDVSGSP